jgi:hypothetical protein
LIEYLIEIKIREIKGGIMWADPELASIKICFVNRSMVGSRADRYWDIECPVNNLVGKSMAKKLGLLKENDPFGIIAQYKKILEEENKEGRKHGNK